MGVLDLVRGAGREEKLEEPTPKTAYICKDIDGWLVIVAPLKQYQSSAYISMSKRLEEGLIVSGHQFYREEGEASKDFEKLRTKEDVLKFLKTRNKFQKSWYFGEE